MAYLDKYSFQGMPSFRDPNDGTVWVWDSSSKTYTKKQKIDEAPRGSQTGGDNKLFDPFQHTEMTDVPELAGHMAAFSDTEFEGDRVPNRDNPTVICPNCQNVTERDMCELCGKELIPEWNKKEQEEGIDPYLHQTQNSPPNEFYSDPEREVKRNRMKTDDSYPSMLSSTQTYDLAVKIARRTLSQDEWDDFFAGGDNKVEIGKWIMSTDGQLYSEQGLGAMHETIAEQNGFDPYSPQDVIALGSVYNDQTADTQRVDNPDQFDLEGIQARIQQVFGPVTLQPPFGMNAPEDAGKGEQFQPFELQGGSWIIRTQSVILGTAWVKERSNGVQYDPSMILVAEHLQPEDASIYDRGVAAIITATGGLSSHAAILATTKGYPVVAGLGDGYNKIETGNYLKIDATSKTIAVMPGANPNLNREIHDSFKEIDKKQNPFYHLKDRFMEKPTFFAHVDEETAWKLANEPSLDSCPECHGVLSERDGEKFCPDCGHKQPIITTGSQKKAVLPALALGMGARAMMGSGMMGKLMGSALGQSAIGRGIGMGVGMQAGPEVAGMIPGVNMIPGLGPEMVEQPPVAPGAVNQGMLAHFLYAGTFGEEEVGTATKNRGEGSDPELDGSGADWEEKGDGPELLKDDENGGSTSPDQAGQQEEQHGGNPEMEEMALKAFEVNLPLILEFAESDNSGADHPIIQAIDNLLEEAFPGYKEIKEEIEEETGLDIDGDGEQGESPEHVEEVEEAADEFGKEADEAEEEDEEFPLDEEEDEEDFDKLAMNEMGLVIDAAGNVIGQFASYNPNGTIKVLTRTGYQDMDPNQVRIEKAANVKEGWNSGIAPQEMPMQQQQPPQSVGVGTCPLCGQNHQQGTPCPMPVQQPQAQPQVGMQPMVAPNIQPKVVTHTKEAEDYHEGVHPGDAGLAPEGTIDQPNHSYGDDLPPSVAEGSRVYVGESLGTVTNPGAGFNAVEVTFDDGRVAVVDMDDLVPADSDRLDPAFREPQQVEQTYRDNEWRPPPPGQEFHRGSIQHVTDDDFMWSKTAELSGWVTEDGRPLEEGNDYHLHSEDYAVPDRITVENVTPEKLTFVIHSGDVDYKDQISKTELETYQYTFKPADIDKVDSMSSWEEQEDPRTAAVPGLHNDANRAFGPNLPKRACPECGSDRWHHTAVPEARCADCGAEFTDEPMEQALPDYNPPIRPGHDPLPQQTDLTSPATKVSGLEDYTGSFDGDQPDSRDWINEGSGVDVDPELMAKLAGKDYSPREQREFIDEDGEARNLDKLELDGTHYLMDELDSSFNW